jgi:outer membrane protein OmpA-like peptidoglycan-associated protein
MRFSRLLGYLVAFSAWNVATAFAAPAPQVTVEGLVNSLNAPAANSDGCEPGFEKGDTGECEPVKGAGFGFNTGAVRGNVAPRPPANATGSSPPPNATAAQRPLQASLQPRSADLLLTFEVNSAALTQQGMVNARVFVTALNDPRLRGSKFEIEGHTDASGSREYNLALSQRRAEAVKQFLVSQGVSPDRLTTVGYGFDRLANAADPRSAENRRVVARRIQ